MNNFIVKCIKEPTCILYFKEFNCFTTDISMAYKFITRDNALKIQNLYPELDLQIERL